QPSQVSVVLAHTQAVAYGSRGGSATVFGTQTAQLCAKTPCAVAMPQGQVELAFQGLNDESAQSSDTLEVKKRPLVVRHALGEGPTYPGPYYGGLVLATSGLVLGATGLLITSTTTYDSAAKGDVHEKFLGMDQGTVLVVSGLLLAGGIALAYLFQPTVR